MAVELDFAAIRVRPAAVESVGLTRDALHELGGLLAESENGSVENVLLSPVAMGSAETFAMLTEVLEDLVQRAQVVVLDLSFPDANYRSGGLDMVLSAALDRVESPTLSAHRVLLVVDRLPAPSDYLRVVIGRGIFAKRMIAIDSRGAVFRGPEAEWTLPDDVPLLVRPTPSGLRETVARKLIRRRGVFRTRPEAEVTAFRYTAEACVPELAALLRHYFNEQEIEVAVYDAGTSEWLAEAVKAACFSDRVCFSIEDVISDDEGDDEIADLVAASRAALSERPRTCLVLPMFKTGRTMRTAFERITNAVGFRVRALSVMADRHVAVDAVDVGAASRIQRELGGQRTPVDWLVEVEHEVLTTGDWRVRAATVSGEIENPAAAWTYPSKVGLWSLFTDLGSEPETPFPSVRPRVASFPALRKMGGADALWLAEAVVRVAQNELRCERSDLLVVMPDEESGSRPIGSALEKGLEVVVAQVPRDVLTEDATPDRTLSRRLRDYEDHSILLLDESTVTYGTLNRLDSFLLRTIKRQADLAVAVVEAQLSEYIAQRPTRLHTLYRWRPVRMIQAAG